MPVCDGFLHMRVQVHESMLCMYKCEMQIMYVYVCLLVLWLRSVTCLSCS
jgi:hypothetical protein